MHTVDHTLVHEVPVFFFPPVAKHSVHSLITRRVAEDRRPRVPGKRHVIILLQSKIAVAVQVTESNRTFSAAHSVDLLQAVHVILPLLLEIRGRRVFRPEIAVPDIQAGHSAPAYTRFKNIGEDLDVRDVPVRVASGSHCIIHP